MTIDVAMQNTVEVSVIMWLTLTFNNSFAVLNFKLAIDTICVPWWLSYLGMGRLPKATVI